MKYILNFVGLFFFITGFGQEFNKKLDTLTGHYKDLGYNAVVLAGNKDSIKFSKAIGYRNLKMKLPMELNTRFKIESAGKLFTATRIMQLVAEKKIHLTDKINQYLPELNIPNGELITIHHLLNHTSGLASHWETSQFNSAKVYSLKEIVASTPVRFNTPGEKSYYSNSAYFILEGLIEKIDGIPFYKSIQKNIFYPAGMENTGPLTENRLPANAAQPYYQVTINEYAEDTSKYIASTQLGAGGWISTAEDLYKFVQAYLNEKYFSSEIIQMQLTANGTKADTTMGFRYGVMNLSNVKSLPPIFGHNGGGRGFSVDVFFERKSGTIVVLCANLFGVGYGFTRNIFHAILKDSLTSQITPPAHIALGTVIRKKGTGYLLDHPDSLFEELNIKPSERILMNTAENFLQLNDLRTSSDILKFIRKKYPESSYAFLISSKVELQRRNLHETKELLNQALLLAEKSNDLYVLEEAKKILTTLK